MSHLKSGEKAVILLSGGLDSAVLAAHLTQSGYCLYGLSFDYGQKSAFEVSCAKKIAQKYAFVAHWIQSIQFHWGGSSLLDSSLRPPLNALPQEGEVSNTYVPGRNTVFLSYALSCAEVVGARSIFIAAHTLDYGQYPDCRPAYFEAYNALIVHSLSVHSQPISIQTPFIQFSKSDIISLGDSLGVDFSETVSCYFATEEGLACGSCSSCLFRRRAFHQSGVSDTTRYQFS